MNGNIKLSLFLAVYIWLFLITEWEYKFVLAVLGIPLLMFIKTSNKENGI